MYIRAIQFTGLNACLIHKRPGIDPGTTWSQSAAGCGPNANGNHLDSYLIMCTIMNVKFHQFLLCQCFILVRSFLFIHLKKIVCHPLTEFIIHQQAIFCCWKTLANDFQTYALPLLMKLASLCLLQFIIESPQFAFSSKGQLS